MTSQPRHYEIAVVAVYLLGGAERAVDTEDAAIRCHELAPSLFSWQKHKSQINLELVRVSLSDAKKQKHGGLLSGAGREGWRLTPSGLDWIRGPGHELVLSPKALKEGESKAGSIDSVRRQRERARIQGSRAWLAWTSSGAIDVKSAREVFRIDDYTTDKMLEIKIARIRGMFEGDAELSPFLESVSQCVSAENNK